MTDGLQKATGVFEKWSSILVDKSLDLSKRILCFKASVLSSLGWKSGPWTLTKKQEVHLASWGARLHARMLGSRRGPEEDIGSFLDADTKNGSSVHEKTQYLSCEHVPCSKTQNGGSLRTSRRHTHTLWQKCSIVVIAVGGVSNRKIGK